MSQAQIAHYQLRSRLGQGAMGVVFRARDERLERDVAIKLLQVSLDTAEAADYAARLLQEARSAARLNHPGIITVYDCGEWRGKPYLAMELVQGITLKDILEKRGTLSIRDAVRIAKQMFDALAHAHEHDVVHRDIKPANLMLTKEGRLKITDFGIAQLPASDLTRTGTILGSPRYMSPEQLAGTKLDGRADIYSAGVVLYQALTGKVPFDGETTMNIVFNILHSEPVDPLTFNPEIPLWLVSLTLQCLAKKREDRFASAAEVVAAIQAAGANPASAPQSSSTNSNFESKAEDNLATAAEVEPSPLLGWLRQTATTLMWLLQGIAQGLKRLAQLLWPYCILALAKLKHWAPIVFARLGQAWRAMRPHLLAGLHWAKQRFFALPKQAQAALVLLCLAWFTWLMWPSPKSEIAAATIVWNTPSPIEIEATTLAVTPQPELAGSSYSESQTEPKELDAVTPEPKVVKPPADSPPRNLQQFGRAFSSAISGTVACFRGKGACPTPHPEPRRGG